MLTYLTLPVQCQSDWPLPQTTLDYHTIPTENKQKIKLYIYVCLASFGLVLKRNIYNVQYMYHKLPKLVFIMMPGGRRPISNYFTTMLVAFQTTHVVQGVQLIWNVENNIQDRLPGSVLRVSHSAAVNFGFLKANIFWNSYQILKECRSGNVRSLLIIRTLARPSNTAM